MKNANLKLSKDQLIKLLTAGRRNAAFMFIIFLAIIYGFLVFRILQLTQAEPDQAAVTAELKTIGVPKIDEEVVRKMEQLEDNSVSVHTLFDEARSNPFEE
jgi:hypothetical protein